MDTNELRQSVINVMSKAIVNANPKMVIRRLQADNAFAIYSNVDTTDRIGNTTYKRGDIVFKTNDNQQIHIKSAQTGYYEPTTIEVVKEDTQQTNTCKITYEYKSGSNDSGQTTVQLKNFSPEAPDSGILYNEKYTLLANEIKELNLPKGIAPIYDVRLQSTNGYGEKIINAVSVSYDASMSKCTFKNNSSLPVVVLIK